MNQILHKLLFSISIMLLFQSIVGCNESITVNNKPQIPEQTIVSDSNLTITEPTIQLINIDPEPLEQSLIDAGLSDINNLDHTILINLKYASTDNFMDTNIYGNLKHAYLQPEVAKSLVDAQLYLKSIDSSLTLLIYDAVRPRSVQQFMWDYLDLPVSEKIKFVSNPKNGSIHNYGSAVDLTIANTEGIPLDMGAKYDEIGKIAYPRLEKHYLKLGELTQQQINNRQLLRRVMKQAQFTGISTEWWHFNRYSRAKAKQLYEIVE